MKHRNIALTLLAVSFLTLSLLLPSLSRAMGPENSEQKEMITEDEAMRQQRAYEAKLAEHEAQVEAEQKRRAKTPPKKPKKKENVITIYAD